MECFNCKEKHANCYYSPKALTKYNIFFCSKCISMLKNTDMSYFYTREIAEKELTLLLKDGVRKWK